MFFRDRLQAGELLALKLQQYQNKSDLVVLGLPRGGVIAAYAVAKALNAPLDVLCLRKIGAPHNPELAVGAISASGESYLNDALIEYLNVPQAYLRHQTNEERKLAQYRLAFYRKTHPAVPLENKTVILVDDGLATGATMHASIATAEAAGASHVVVAIPVASLESLRQIESEANEVICLYAPVEFHAVGQFYENFDAIEDDVVVNVLRKSLMH